MTDLTLGAGLAAPMQPDSDPSVLPWRVTRYDLDWRTPGGLTVGAFAAWYGQFDGRPDDMPWNGFCVGPGDTRYDEWHETAEAARAAVENHIAAHIEARLKGAHEHNWVDFTPIESPVLQFFCTGCHDLKEEPR